MAKGDTLHIIIIDESGDPVTFDLVGEEGEVVTTVPGAPTVGEATDITASSFTANWFFNESTSGYYLDVASDSGFASFVVGFNNLNVSNVNSYSVVGLSSLTPYYYRIRSYNEAGTSESSEFIFVETSVSTGIRDRDGNVYTTVILGNQEWMVENLKTTKYADNSTIPTGLDNAQWTAEDGSAGHDGAFAFVNEDAGTKGEYGLLYNWYAVSNTKQLVNGQFEVDSTPSAGWRVPTKADFQTLIIFIGDNHDGEINWEDEWLGLNYGGGKLRSVGFTHWDPFDPENPISGTDEFGFRGYGAGDRCDTGQNQVFKISTFFWTSTEEPGNLADDFQFSSSDTTCGFAFGGDIKRFGFSVRCVRDVV